MRDPIILREDPDFLIVDKPAHMLTHATVRSRADETTLTAWLLKRFPEIRNVGDDPEMRPGIVHRLDRETSGCIVVARNNDAFYTLKKLFQERGIEKIYVAIVWGYLSNDEGSINKPIGLKPGTTKRTTFIRNAKMIKEAETHYRVLERLSLSQEPVTFLEVLPKTGRTHQIRVHLNEIHHPLLGDALYGGRVKQRLAHKLNIPRLMLHAQSLTFASKKWGTITAKADYPSDFESVLMRARSDHQDHDLHN